MHLSPSARPLAAAERVVPEPLDSEASVLNKRDCEHLFQQSSDPNVARVVFPEDGTVGSVFIEGTELTLMP
jgi:hypothetical protein